MDVPDDPGNPNGTLRVADAARYLGVGRKVLYRLIEQGRIRATRQSRVVWVDRASLKEFHRSGELT